MCLADDRGHDPDDENKKNIKHKSEKSNPVKSRSPDMQPESDKKAEMSAEQQKQLFALHKAMEHMAKDKDPDMQLLLQTMLDLVNTAKANTPNSAASSSSTSPEAATPDDAKMEEEATDPGVTKVSVNADSDEESNDPAF